MTTPDTLPTIAFETAALFETWLAEHHNKSHGIWLKLFKKNSGIQSVTYAEALDAALCYGWIDGQKLAFDEQAWLQKFCPRRPKSIWSKINTGHVERLIREGRMQTAGLEAVAKARADGRWEKAYDSPGKAGIPEDFLEALSKNQAAEIFFKGLNKTNLYAIAFRLQTAKKEETRIKRMQNIIEMLAKGETFH